MTRLLRSLPFLGLAVVAFASPGAPHRTPPTLQETPVVRAVLFYSPSCPRCQEVITEDLPPLMDTYGAQLEIVGINVTFAEGQTLFQAAWEQYSIPEDLRGVPLLVIGDTWLVGARDIPEQLPGLIEEGLAQGGIDWPEIPGLAEALAQVPAQNAPQPTPIPPLTLRDKLLRDPIANGLAIAVLVGMVISLGLVAYRLWSARGFELPAWTGWLFLALTLVGMAVAGYLTYVETSGATAVCGPVGDCNTVQQSAYARLFGVVPMGLVGLAGYAAILIAWVIAHATSARTSDWARVALLGLAAIGTAFSIGLTFLEPFVIGATCAWCLTSAVVMTVLLWLASGPGIEAMGRLQPPPPEIPEPPSTPDASAV